VNLDSKQILKILNQPSMIQKAPARFPRYQQIQVAVLIRLAAGHGAKDAQIVGAAPLGETKNLVPPFYP
jgi:hypothetical protein